jgi:hypothetical protein
MMRRARIVRRDGASRCPEPLPCNAPVDYCDPCDAQGNGNGEVLFRSVPTSVLAQGRDGVIVTPRRPESAEDKSIAATGHPTALMDTLKAPVPEPIA